MSSVQNTCIRNAYNLYIAAIYKEIVLVVWYLYLEN